MSENARCVRALLDLGVEPRTIDRERDPPGDVLHQREIVRSVGSAARDSGDRDRADRALAGAERDADQRARVDATEEPIRFLAVRALAEGGKDLRIPAGNDRAYGFVRLLLRRVAGLCSPGLGARNGEALQRRAFFGQVDQAPVAEVSDDQLGDPLDRRLVVGRAGDVPDLAEQIEPALSLDRLRCSSALRGEQPVCLVLHTLALADVNEEALSEERLAIRAGDDPRVLAEPDHFTVPRQHPVLALEGGAALGRSRDPGEHSFPIVWMEDPLEQLAVPLFG